MDPIWPPLYPTLTTGPHYSRRGDRQAAPRNPLPCFPQLKVKRVSTRMSRDVHRHVSTCPSQLRTTIGGPAASEGVCHRLAASEGVCNRLATSEGVPECPTMSESLFMCPSISDEVCDDPLSFLLSLKHPEDPQVSTKTLTHRKQSHCSYHYTVKAH